MIKKLIVNNRYVPVDITENDNRLWLKFGFNKTLADEIKSMQDAKWHGFETTPVKAWSIPKTPRNLFQLAFLEGKNPYALYDAPLPDVNPRRDLYEHQKEIFKHIVARRYCIVSAEMGTGKTLASIEAIEWLAMNKGMTEWMYIAPKSALTAVQLEFEKWKSVVYPSFYTYDALKSLLQNWKGGAPPHGVIFDESSRVKTPTSQRSVAAKHLADNIRDAWGEKGCVVLMSGSPAPKSPLDWWFQCEIACPGFIKEGSYEKFRKKMAVMGEGRNDSGQVFARLISWKDNSDKCDKCGKLANDPCHDSINMVDPDYHLFTPSVNEVKRLYNRMSGLVIVKFKKDCLDLPEKQYRQVVCKPNQSIINAAKLISASCETTIKTITLLRELSDGFQYAEKDIGTEVCPLCDGKRSRLEWQYVGPNEEYERVVELQMTGQVGLIPEGYFQELESACVHCSGTGEVTKFTKEAVQMPCPKEDALLEIIDQHEDVGRLVTYAGFTGSVERCVQIFLRAKWDVIRVDGRGWWSNTPGDAKTLLKRFQNEKEAFPRMAFIGQPGAAGMGLTLTASPTIVYYSNDFNGESRIQSEDRIHRPGMDKNRGATIIDLIHLPSDLVVLENLNKKRKLQDMSMGEFRMELTKCESTNPQR